MRKLVATLGACALVVGAPMLHAQDFITDEDILIKTPEGVTLSAFVARPRDESRKLPAALQFTIYADRSAMSKALVTSIVRRSPRARRARR